MADPSGSWEPSTAEEYIDQQIATVNATKADKSATVSTVSYDTTNKKITKTINGVTTDVVTVETLVTDGGIALKTDLANEKLGNGIGTCSTSSGTALVVTLSGYNLVENGFVAVTFSNDVPANATLNVNGKGAKPIIYKGAAIEANTIKADDTVMFSYDGTSYVVTSLGGGSTQMGELVIINLSTDDNDDSDLIGASVKIYNTNNVSTVYLNTTWQGNNIQIIIPVNVDYTVEVASSIGEHDIETNTQSYTAELVQRNVNFVYNALWVDLGLPSGISWARKNIDASQPNGFAVSAFQYECSFFSWGNVVGHNPISDSAFDYDFISNYASTPGSQLTGNIPTNATYDAARAILGSPWRMATTSEFQELLDNCDCVQADGTTIITETNKLVTINNIVGLYLKSKINSAHLFFPCCGRAWKDTWVIKGSCGAYWSSNFLSSEFGYRLNAESNKVLSSDTDRRPVGCIIRPIR